MQSIELTTPSGKLRGSLARSCLGDDYFAFKGIPYARPPLGPLRFCDPKPIEPWSGVRDASNFGPPAMQFDMATNKIIGSEDCLYLNVYSRELKPTLARAPVMFWIHGGAFVIGKGDDEQFGPDYLLARGVVLVTVNYRLGVFGFLNVEDEAATGNQGLKDQTMALRWVNSHISSFGGDPDNVTIFGGSAGGASVHLLTLSPLCKGLFHKAICQSGCALAPWAIKDEPIESLREFLRLLGCKETEPRAIVDYLRAADCNTLIEAQEKLLRPLDWVRLCIPFSPCVDKKSARPLLPEHPSLSAKKGVQVPILMGYNSLEGIFATGLLQLIGKKQTEEFFTKTSNDSMLKYYNMSIKELIEHYARDEKIPEDSKFLALWSDVIFNESLHRFAKAQCRVSCAPTYFYRLSFDDNESVKKMRADRSLKGAAHGDELFYLFKMKTFEASNLEQLPNTCDRLMRQMTEFWTNFAKIGRPSVTTSESIPIYWQPLDSPDVIRYMSLGEQLRMDKMLSFEQRLSLAQFKEASA